jgi:hypothetical protein
MLSTFKQRDADSGIETRWTVRPEFTAVRNAIYCGGISMTQMAEESI